LKSRCADFPHLDALREFLARIRTREHPLAILLFGSLANGQHLPGSDIDVAIIFAHDVDSMQEGAELSRLDDSGLIQPFAMSLNQLERRIEDLNPLVLEIVSDGLVLHCSDDICLERIERKLSTVIERFRVERTETRWIIRELEKWRATLK